MLCFEQFLSHQCKDLSLSMWHPWRNMILVPMYHQYNQALFGDRFESSKGTKIYVLTYQADFWLLLFSQDLRFLLLPQTVLIGTIFTVKQCQRKLFREDYAEQQGHCVCEYMMLSNFLNVFFFFFTAVFTKNFAIHILKGHHQFYTRRFF